MLINNLKSYLIRNKTKFDTLILQTKKIAPNFNVIIT